MRYQLRFIFAADVCGAWSLFGGVVAQLNHLSIVLHIATTDAIGIAATYDQLPKAHLEERARARAPGTAGTADFHEMLSNEQPLFKMQAAQQHTKPAAKADPPIKKEKKDQLKRNSRPRSRKLVGFLRMNTLRS